MTGTQDKNIALRKPNISGLPETGYVRLEQIVGSAKKGIQPLLPICRSSWYEGIKRGKYPKPIKLSARTSVYRVEDIRALFDRISSVAMEVQA